ncbi:phospholipase A2 inhibitor and Ly6/PLAUR domain-containing protein isoform X2 [Choloepus didactylus]|uniref:phospholipase A2 inhibitor and Ly6/PLAUR domain-containing protein isoform X2 n=1 Tax=Choloepus didactylus TaxID=27675 RepID=UPI0018A090CA|nr:phospholipase A2 inhibitor and Ly6/PLAUR domain-containing protein isoform X2 [Choloepus didactylus]
MLKGCATPEVCHLPKNAILGLKESGFQLTASPECIQLALPTQPGPQVTATRAEARRTVCFTCSDPHHCNPFPCLAERSYCLQTSGVLALGNGSSVVWRNGSCVASKDCELNTSISALTYSVDFGFWVNTSCCQGNCQEPTPLAPLPASQTLSNFLCPSCSWDLPGPCNASFYQQCPSGETECVQLSLVPEAGGRNVSVRGCGSRALCRRTLARTEGPLALPGHRLAGRPDCSSGQRAVMDSKCQLGAGPRLGAALPVLVVALGTAMLS